ncbi:hypothetical protein [Mycobacterium kubicae]|nr:hypothetical protein [Mycobacterium kubicae]MCV7094181.1 hypothetical protein [Mycobacterium kubicae]OBK54067.1 hypothetical protein A5657_13770 [Mycobacterium kubicae]ORV98518.1 hypothetical protein AWC13_13830 [Mycobacterium kubicae]QNI07628.1 hypothetical protein GAN17_16010 [Mycobacterium kubicae]QNI12613.1 hypothetical protein GAN18_16575 [Mycobacterium kubicae]
MDDHADHYRTTRPNAGETLKNGPHGLGLVGVGAGVLALIIGLFAFATGSTVGGTVAVVLAVVLGAAGFGWLAYAHRKVRTAQLRWHAEHSDRPAPPPTS